MISATTEFNGRICYLQLRISCTQILIDYMEEYKRRSDPWFMNKLHYAKITKDSNNKRGTEKKEICHLGEVSPAPNISTYN